jgi:hypothetical protein
MPDNENIPETIGFSRATTPEQISHFIRSSVSDFAHDPLDQSEELYYKLVEPDEAEREKINSWVLLAKSKCDELGINTEDFSFDNLRILDDIADIPDGQAIEFYIGGRSDVHGRNIEISKPASIGFDDDRVKQVFVHEWYHRSTKSKLTESKVYPSQFTALTSGFDRATEVMSTDRN